jgi:hypothetical protein
MNLYKLLKEQINMDRQAFSGAWLNSAAAGVVLGPIYTLPHGGVERGKYTTYKLTKCRECDAL